ncbi:hypothetical protein JL36_08420 [Lactococcus cremoris]|nr:hypothetical protein JL36_08420 [Lactococcus cremoris]
MSRKPGVQTNFLKKVVLRKFFPFKFTPFSLIPGGELFSQKVLDVRPFFEEFLPLLCNPWFFFSLGKRLYRTNLKSNFILWEFKIFGFLLIKLLGPWVLSI